MFQEDDFKYIIQDTNCIYFGKELTYNEMMKRDDLPFKFKAIINSYIQKEIDLDTKIISHLMQISEEDFIYKIFEQLKLTVRICYKVYKKGITGKMKEKWIHKACSLKTYCKEYRNIDEFQIEDISISKLALMTISI